jgi:hypothetical protein
MKKFRLPSGRCYLPEFLQLSGMSKNTFFRVYRHSDAYAALLDVQEDHLHRVHLPIAAAKQLKRERRAKANHGNRGRTPKRRCPHCAAIAHPRHRVCPACGQPLPAKPPAVEKPV